MAKENKYKIVLVEWFDAQSSLDSFTIDDIKNNFKPIYTRSVGYLVEYNRDYIILVFTDFGDGIFKHVQCIPKAMIKQIKVLKVR